MEYRSGAPSLTADNQVETTEIATLADYRSVTPSEDFSLLIQLARQFEGKKLVFLNSTIQGGGVALMRHALIRLFRLLSVDAHWYVMIPRPAAFVVTKRKFHDVLQAVANKQVILTEKDKRIYRSWIIENVQKFAPIFQQADVIVIDDPQPSGLIPFIRKANPFVKIIYRSHIHIVSSLVDQPGTPQQTTWSFLWKSIKGADCFVSHPVKAFVPGDVPAQKVVLMPATTDPLDGLNRPLTEEEMAHYLTVFNQCLFDVGDTTHVAHHLYALFTNADSYQRMSRAAACLYNNKDFLTVSNAICWLFLALWLLEKGEIEGYYQDVKTLAYHYYASQQGFHEIPAES